MPKKVILGKLNQQNKQIKSRNSTLHSVNPGKCTPLCDACCPLMLCSGADASLQWEPLYIRPYASASFVCTRNVVCCALGDSLRAESHSQLKTRSCSSPPKPTYPSQHCLHLHVASFVQAHFTVDTFRARHDVPPCRADLPPQAKHFSSAAAALLLSAGGAAMPLRTRQRKRNPATKGLSNGKVLAQRLAYVQWLKTHNMTADDLQPYFWSQMRDKVLPTLPSKKILGVWENDVFQVDPSSLPKDSIVNVYQSLKTAIKALQMNLTTTVSIAGSHWYLDSECGGYNQNAWKCIYNVDPGSVTAGLPSYQAELLIGGEVAMWGEGINQDNFDAFVWRAASAAAERLWSRLDLTPTADASTLARLASFACRLSKRGIKVGPVGPGFCPSDADEVSRVVAMEVEPLNRSERIELEMLREMLKRK